MNLNLNLVGQFESTDNEQISMNHYQLDFTIHFDYDDEDMLFAEEHVTNSEPVLNNLKYRPRVYKDHAGDTVTLQCTFN